MTEGVPAAPIAVIGVGCRFPGASGPDAFWKLVRSGGDAIREIPADRPGLSFLRDPRPGKPGPLVNKWGGFLEGVDRFDAAFFSISPREADRLDPQQRLLLEAAWEAIEDGGQVDLAGSSTGVFVGLWINDYEALLFDDPSRVDFYMTTGSGRYSASGRLSYAFGLQGPSLTVDTACSSSLVAVHLACRALRGGECDLALAGGANTILTPQVSLAYSQSQMLAADGRCKFGDARGDGYVRSEGAGVVALKLLSRALADGDPIQAVILGSAVNNDGKTSGFLATPGQGGQEDLLRKAYADAGIEPGRVQYVEAHGTGTSVGDPVELSALGAVLGEGRPADQPCLVGSVKTNIGHTEGAAGVAGLIKVVLALKNGTIPASLHFETPNPAVPWATLPVAVPREARSWPAREGLALAGVSAFGIAGTNAHVVLQAAPSAPDGASDASAAAPRLLALSARSPQALKDLAAAWRAPLRSAPEDFADLCYTAAVRRAHHEHRLAIVARGGEEAAEKLDSFLQGEHLDGGTPPAAAGGPPRVVFVFPGQGSQWLGMARQMLADSSVFRASLEACDRAVREESGFSVLEELAAGPERSHLDQIDVVQPMLFSIQVALAAVWRSWGIAPAAVVGHSMGEVAAAHVAGILSLEDAAAVICRRSRLLRRTRGQGAMAVVDLSMSQAQAATAGYEDRLSVAVSNSSRSTVLSGDPAALDEVIAALERDEVFCRRVKVDVASHSPQMDALRGDLVEALRGVRPRPGLVPLYSTVTAQLADGTLMGAEYWARNLREPVMFSTAVGKLVAEGHSAFVELSAHPILLPAIQQELQYLRQEAAVLPSLRREEDERATMLESLGALHVLGSEVEWKELLPAGGRCLRLPSYPWQRERFWYDASSARRERGASARRGAHPLVGPHLASSTDAGQHFFETDLGPEVVPWTSDHRVDGLRVLPAAAYVEMALAAAAEAFGGRPSTVSTVSFERALPVPESDAVAVQVKLSSERSGAASFHISSREAAKDGQPAEWTLHAKGEVRFDPSVPPLDGNEHVEIPEMPSANAAGTGAPHYQAMAGRGLHYGPGFQGVQAVWTAGGDTVARIALPESLRGEAAAYRIHPALLDAGFQLLVAAAAGTPAGAKGHETLVPVSLDTLQIGTLPTADKALWARARVRPEDAGRADSMVGDVVLSDDEGRVVLDARGLRLQRLLGRDRELDRSFFTFEWDAATRPAPAVPPSGSRRWLVFSDGSGVGAAVAARLTADGDSVGLVLPRTAAGDSAADGYRIDPERPEDFRRVLADARSADGEPLHGVVHLWSLDAGDPGRTGAAALREAQTLGSATVLYLVQALLAETGPAPRLWLVTAGSQAAIPSDDVAGVAEAPLWGLGRVVAREHPDLRCTAVDVSASSREEEVASLADELRLDGPEDQIALRGSGRFVARLRRRLPEEAAAAHEPVRDARLQRAAGRPFHAAISKPGVLDNLVLRAAARRAPARGQVEIEVCATGLNFMNVMSALGILPGYEGGVGPLGLECAGRVCAVGDGVELAVGDEVLAVAPDSLASHVLVDARLVVRKPARFGFEEGVTIPIVFLTAYYALHHLARVQPGERVLVHAAAGGVGLAALQILRRAGAEVLATAGSPEKRDLLRSLGVRHVMDSRSLAFGEEVRTATGGEGVDVVLNSLAGEAISTGIDILRPFGRFLEIGKRDIYRNAPLSLGPFRQNLSYFAIDLDRMIRERPAQVGALLREVMGLVESGDLSPLPLRTFPVGEMAEAFRHMAQGHHVGKVVLRIQGEDPQIEAAARPSVPVSDGTYLVTGGLGGLGLEVAAWLAAKGARHLALVGRSEPGPAATAAIQALERAGACVRVARADVAEESQVARVLAEIDETMPPLRGVVHAAGILDDGTVLNLDRARLEAVLAPKVAGAWNLHALTAARNLDFFVLFSSVASLLGSPGQANYAAGNAFLDALAAYRRARGLTALSIDWGPWSGVGLAAAGENRGARLARRGLGSLSPEQGLAAMERLLRQAPAQVAVMAFDFQQWCGSDAALSASPLLAGLAGESAGSAAAAPSGSVREELLAVEPGRRRRALLEDHLRRRVAQVLRLAPARVEVGKPLRALGLDSLMALELRNRLEADFQLKLPATLVWNHPTVTALAPHLAERMGIPIDAGESDAVALITGRDEADLVKVLNEIEQMTTDEARRLLSDHIPQA
jgi:acyl transferase domain-containing protein/acyl carrier protein